MNPTLEVIDGHLPRKSGANRRYDRQGNQLLLGRPSQQQQPKRRNKKKKLTDVKRVDGQKSRQRIADVANQVAVGLESERPTSHEAAAYFVDEEQTKTKKRQGLYFRARSIPTDWGLDDYVQLLKFNSGASTLEQYVPPWRRQPVAPIESIDSIKSSRSLILEPDVRTRLPERVPGSCPCSPEPIYLHEVPDSEPDLP